MHLTQKDIHDALSTVQDPDLHKDLVTLNMVKDVRLDGENVAVTIELTTPACPMKDRIRDDIVSAINDAASRAGAGAPKVEVEFTADVRTANERAQDKDNPLPGVKHIIAVGAGKGGVGKSFVSSTLAIGLARHGASVGLLDGDIYGPSMTTMLGLEDARGRVKGQTLLPFEVHGIRAMTIGKLVEPDKALIWRGPMAHGAFRQLAMQTDWGELDYLIVDLPPGTGDVPLTLAQLLPLSGAVVVCTPQKVAQDDARRAVRMFEQLGVDVLGIIENMSYFVGDDGKEYDIFGRGGAMHLAKDMDVPVLGEIPIHMQLRQNCDDGRPLSHWQISDSISAALDQMCQSVAQQVSIRAAAGRYVQPTVSVS